MNSKQRRKCRRGARGKVRVTFTENDNRPLLRHFNNWMDHWMVRVGLTVPDAVQTTSKVEFTFDPRTMGCTYRFGPPPLYSLADFRRDSNNRPWRFTGKINLQPTQE
jgi:hypothetical protein